MSLRSKAISLRVKLLFGEHESGAVWDSSRSTLELLHDRLHISTVTHIRQLYIKPSLRQEAAEIHSKYISLHLFGRVIPVLMTAQLGISLNLYLQHDLISAEIKHE